MKAVAFMKYCCEKFKKESGELKALTGGGFLYPPEMRPPAQFEPSKDGETWNINGCCGGGCFVVTEMRYCPFCGSKLKGVKQPGTNTAGVYGGHLLGNCGDAPGGVSQIAKNEQNANERPN